ncbi:hypothetical protein ACTQ1U_08100 [Thermoguttaceae bacterium LCP21S3_D4]|nr:SdpI family protein [Lachnospiraceae bacterium]HCJ76867.1 hypothetical protein [Roseburia sp.]
MGKYAILILPITLSIIILIAGSIVFYMPLRWEERQRERYPAYRGKKAKQSEEHWNRAQKLYGRCLLLLGSIDLLFAYPLTRCFYWFVEAFWHKEDATLPAVLILCVPSFGFILSAYLITRKKLR